ncbi:ABC transporter permease subunit, partial [Brachybacterium alimentarium]
MPSTHAPAHRERTTTIPTILARVLFLGAVLAVAAFSVPVMIQLQQWMWLSIVVLATIAIFALYSTKRFVPGKYLFPGTLF